MYMLTRICVDAVDILSVIFLLNPLHIMKERILQARILEWVPFPSPGDLPDPGIEPRSPILQADSLPSEPPGKPLYIVVPLNVCGKLQRITQNPFAPVNTV